jgi:(p)ppGpp synthase/HD superfamily hydrolase
MGLIIYSYCNSSWTTTIVTPSCVSKQSGHNHDECQAFSVVIIRQQLEREVHREDSPRLEQETSLSKMSAIVLHWHTKIQSLFYAVINLYCIWSSKLLPHAIPKLHH